MVLERRPTRVVVVIMKMIMVMVVVVVVVIRRIWRRLLAINEGRGDTIDFLQSRNISIQHTFFFFVAFTFLFPLANI